MEYKASYDKLMEAICPMLCNCADCDACLPGEPLKYIMERESYGKFTLEGYDKATNEKIMEAAARLGFRTTYDGTVISFKKNKICYIAGKISGEPDYMDKFSHYATRIKEELGFEVINPAAVSAILPAGIPYEGYIDLGETLLSLCDSIFLIPGWEKSKGARFEHAWAATHGLEAMTEDEHGNITHMCI